MSKLRPAAIFRSFDSPMAKVLGILCLIPVLAEKACHDETCDDSSTLMQLNRCLDHG